MMRILAGLLMDALRGRRDVITKSESRPASWATEGARSLRKGYRIFSVRQCRMPGQARQHATRAHQPGRPGMPSQPASTAITAIDRSPITRQQNTLALASIRFSSSTTLAIALRQCFRLASSNEEYAGVSNRFGEQVQNDAAGQGNGSHVQGMSGVISYDITIHDPAVLERCKLPLPNLSQTAGYIPCRRYW